MAKSITITVRELNRGLEVDYSYNNLNASEIDRLVLTLTDQTVQNDEKTITFSENDGLEKDANTFVINNLTVDSEYSIRLFAILDSSNIILESNLVKTKVLDLVEPDFEARGVTNAIRIDFDNLVAFGEQCNILGETGRVELYGTEFKKTGGVERIFNAGKIDISNAEVPTEFRVNELKNLVRYEINVSYVNSLGRKSVTKSATPSKLLEPPQDVSLNMIETNAREAFLLQWQEPSNVAVGEYDKAAYYWIYRSTSEQFDVSDNNRIHILDTSGLSPTDLSYVDADPSLNHGTKYYYRISGVRKRDNSGQPEEPDVNDRDPSDDLIEGLASQELEGYFFKHIDVRSEKPSVTYSPSVDNQLVDISLVNPASTTLYDSSAQEYEIAYDLSYSVIKHDESVDLSGVHRFTLNDNSLDDVLEHIQSELDLSMNYGETLEFELRMVQIYRSDEFVSLYSDKQLATAHSTPQAPINLRYTPDRDNDKQFHLSWDDLHYDADANNNVSPYDSYIKYKVFSVTETESGTTETELTGLETSGNSVLVREEDLSMNYNELYKFKVQAVLYENVEHSEDGDKHGKTAEDLVSVLSEELEVLIFEHVNVGQVTITHAIAQDNKDVNVKLIHPLTYVSQHVVDGVSLYSSYYDVSHSKAVEESESVVEASYNVVNVEQEEKLATLVHGNELSYQVQLVQLYRGYEFRNEISNERSVTTHSKPSTPTRMIVRSTTDDGLEPLSSPDTNGDLKGKLKVSWDPIVYDQVLDTNDALIDGKYTNSIKYRILNKSQSGHLVILQEDISENNCILEDLVIGTPYDLYVQAYYNNTEFKDHDDNVVSEVNSDTSLRNNSILTENLLFDNTRIPSVSSISISDINGYTMNRGEGVHGNRNKIHLYTHISSHWVGTDERNIQSFEMISNNYSLDNVKVKDLSSIEVKINMDNNANVWIAIYTEPANGEKWYDSRFNFSNNYINNNSIDSATNIFSLSLNDDAINSMNRFNYDAPEGPGIKTYQSNIDNPSNNSEVFGDEQLLAIAITSNSGDSESYNIYIKSVTLTLRDGTTKTITYTGNQLNKFDSAIYNEKFNVPFYYPDAVSGLQVNREDVQPVGLARHTLPLEWNALENEEARGTTGENIVYDISVISLDDSYFIANHENVGQLNNTHTFDSMTLDHLYQINVRSIVRYNGVDMYLNTSNNIYFLKGSKLRSLESRPSNKTLNVTWNRSLYGMTAHKASFVRYEYKLLNEGVETDSQHVSDRTNSSVVSSELDNGTEYKIEVKSIFSYQNGTFNDNFDSFVSTLQGITTTPFFRPLVTDEELKERSDASGSELTFTLDNNGRPIREYVLVYVPADEGDLFNQDIVLEKASKADDEYNGNDASWNTHVVQKFNMNENGNNTRTDITITTGVNNDIVPYKTKSVLLVFENDAGSKVVTVLENLI